MSSTYQRNTADAARRVIALTAQAWQVRPESPHAIARRAPHGYVPRRLARRMRMAGDVQASCAQGVSARL